MLRVRLVAIGFLVAFVVGALVLPVALGYTFTAGGTATARVVSCDGGGKRLSCEGRWQTKDGQKGEGHISGVDRSDVGRDVEVRIGPLGPYAGGFGRAWPLFLTLLPLLVGPPFVLVTLRRLLGPGREAARRILAQEPGGATVLKVVFSWKSGATGATEADGRPHSTLRTTEAPLAYEPLSLPGAPSRRQQQSAFRTAAGLASGTTGFATAYGPGGEPRFVIERRAFGEHDPEMWLLNPAGSPQAMIRRTGMGEFALLRADGKALGTLRRTDVGVYTAVDQDGREYAAMAAADRTWVLRVEPDTPPILADLTLAFLFDAKRLQN